MEEVAAQSIEDTIAALQSQIDYMDTYAAALELVMERGVDTVSYTHLDVYKRQGFTWPSMTDASETARSSDGTEQHLVFEFETAEGIEG